MTLSPRLCRCTPEAEPDYLHKGVYAQHEADDTQLHENSRSTPVNVNKAQSVTGSGDF